MLAKRWIGTGMILLLCSTLILAACAGPAPPTVEEPEIEQPTAEAPPTEAPEATAPEEKRTLVMLDWGGYELPEFWTAFAESHPDVDVEFSFLTESAEVYSKLKAGFETDLVHPCSNFWKLLAEEGLVQPIDTSKLSNWPDVIPSLAKQGEFDGQQYWVPWDWGFESILARADLVEQVPDAWADIWDPQYAGRIVLNDSGEAAQIFTAVSLGYDPWNTTPDQEDEITDKLMELAPNVLAFWSGMAEVDQMLAAGDAWLGVGAWNASYVNLLDQGYDVEYIDPKEGRMGYLCGFGIPSTSTNVDLAHEMIDAYLAPEAQAYLANEYGYGIVNSAALPLVDKETVDLLSLEDEHVISRTIFYEYITEEQRQNWTDRWSQIKALAGLE
jgi:spermidine/putrescine transport system substrate-binding protein